jgi:hypothetical protein
VSQRHTTSTQNLVHIDNSSISIQLDQQQIDDYYAIQAYINEMKNSQQLKDEDSPSLKEAFKSPESELWKKAAIDELLDLLQDTILPINKDELPPNCKIVPTTIRFKRKGNPITGIVDRYKGRICFRGDLVKLLYHDYLDKTSPTINELTFNFILQLSITMGLCRACSDIIAAYLYQQYPFDKRHIAVKLQPEIAELLGLDPNQLYKLNRYLYGLPDSGKAFYEALVQHIQQYGYHKSSLDPCLFYKTYTNDDIIFICIHVDDIYTFASHQKYINEFNKVL